ncbi:hypothetical protein [Brachybacterium sp.]|nr:hypothetical protein [Brachybacterium sp.]
MNSIPVSLTEFCGVVATALHGHDTAEVIVGRRTARNEREEMTA